MSTSAILYSLGQMSGIIAYSFLALLIFSGDTARFWDRYFGLDKIIKFQKKFSYYTAAFVLMHPLLFVASSGFKNALDYFIPSFASPFLALGIFAFYVFMAVMLASYFYKRISYNNWQYIHVLTYALVFSALIHAYFYGSDKDDYLIIYIVSVILISIGIAYRTHYKIKTLNTRKFNVLNIVDETHDTFTVVLKNDKSFSFEPGQFCFLRINGKKLYARHPFTISSSPDEDNISFTVKLAGRFTQTLKELKEGDEIIMEGPFGVFTPTLKSKGKDLVFFAGGVGITPFISIIKALIKNDNKNNVTLFYSSRSESDIIFKQYLDSLNYNWLKIIYFVKEGGDNYERGYFTKDVIEKYLNNIKDKDVYICGPKPLKDGVRMTLLSMGVKNKSINEEDFFW